MAGQDVKHTSYRSKRGKKNRPSYRDNGTRSHTPALNMTGKQGMIAVAVLVVVALVLGLVTWRLVASPKMDTLAYRDRLISVNQGDLPAPPFIGWEQQFVDEPPEELKPNKAIDNLNNEDCTPGGKRQAQVEGLITHNASEWSATEMYNTSYNAQIRIDASDTFDQNDGRDGGVDYGLIDSYLHDCSYVEFTQTVDDASKTVRITQKPLKVDPDAWNMRDGRAWSQTVAVSSPEGFEGTTTTITALGHGPGATLQAKMTFEGRLDNNAINQMDLLWTAQTTKAFNA